MIPEKLIISAHGRYEAGVAVVLRFKMVTKNDYSYLVFLDANGRKEVTQAELLEEFECMAAFSPMDYVNAAGGFTGAIEARVLSKDEIAQAITAYDTFKKHWKYPATYLANLQRALTVNPASDCAVTVEHKGVKL